MLTTGASTPLAYPFPSLHLYVEVIGVASCITMQVLQVDVVWMYMPTCILALVKMLHKI